MMPSLPTGTVTFLFTDIEGSTQLVQDQGEERFSRLVADYRRLLGAAVRDRGGVEVGAQGDGVLAAFSRAGDGVEAAVAAQAALVKHPWPDGAAVRVRMGLHTGEGVAQSGDYIGLDVHRASRICAAAHGGQILLSQAVRVLATHDVPAAISLRDLGAHRLRDLREAEHLFQVVHPDLPAVFPPIKSLNARPNNLPIQLTTFIGRDEEIREVRALLARARLLTLTGSGGLGKTRLAIQVAAEAADSFPDGVWLVELAGLSDPGLVAQAVALPFGLGEQAGRPFLTVLTDYFQPRHVLLVLDNCEHLIDQCAQLADTLLRACPALQILATSRQSLGVAGETTWRVPPLSSPEAGAASTLEHAEAYEAVRLFADRAAAILPHFSLTRDNAPAVAEVCHQLDGIPLAIELAAARLRVLSVEQIRDRLNQRFVLLTGGSRTALPRHQTLRAAIEWSDALLSPPERILFQRLSVFVGGCAADAAEVICAGQGLPTDEILQLLAQLVDKSLLIADRFGIEMRYRMLETIGEFGRERLRESGEESAVRDRHTKFFLALAERAEPNLHGPNQARWLARLETEHDNLRAALDWSMLQGAAETGLRLANALWWFWYVRGYYAEGRAWFDLALSQAAEATPLRAKALGGAGYLATYQGDYPAAGRFLGESLALARAREDKPGVAQALKSLGGLAWFRGHFEDATTLFDDSLRLFRELNEHYNVGIVLNNLGTLATLRGEFALARTRLQESLAISRQLGDKQHIALAASNLGVIALREGEYTAARTLFRESLLLDRDLGDKRSICAELEEIGLLAAALKRPRRAARLLAAAEALREAIGAPLTMSTRSHVDYDRRIAEVQSGLPPAEFAAVWNDGRAMGTARAIDYALSDEGEEDEGDSGLRPEGGT
jgi:predicted ATPase/class 3 adenylate cyclase/Flp pilus assembly protein TadD